MTIPEQIRERYTDIKNIDSIGMVKKKTMAFTGHRPKHSGVPGYEKAPWQSIVDSMIPILLHYVTECGIRWFVTGGAQGVDQSIFWAVDKLKRSGLLPEDVTIYNSLFVPFEGQHLRWNDDGLFSQSQYITMMYHADHIIICGKSDGSYRSAAAALTSRNQCMLDVSSLVAAFDNNNSTDGGTGDMIRRVREEGTQLDFLRYTTERHPIVTGIQHDGAGYVSMV